MKTKLFTSLIAIPGLLVSLALSAFAAASPLKDSDLKLLQKVTQGSAAEVELGRLAEQRASQASVKEFARKMVQDHQRMAADASRLAREHGAAIASQPGAEEKKELNKLKNVRGAEFDRQYIEGMLDDHKTDVAEVAKYIASHGDSPLVPFLKSTLPRLEDHLRIAENVAGQIGVKPDAGLNRVS